MPLSEAQAWLQERIEDGETCPCCGQLAKIYARKITAPMARGIIEQYRQHGREFVHAPTVVGHVTHEFSQLSWWGLITEERRLRPDGGRAGYWAVSEIGERYVRDREPMPKYAYIYDGVVVRLGTDQHADIIEALGTRFNYYELMRGPDDDH